jgi:hypothetical protein
MAGRPANDQSPKKQLAGDGHQIHSEKLSGVTPPMKEPGFSG